MRFYRIEDYQGLGPYESGIGMGLVCTYNVYDHPMPSADGLPDEWMIIPGARFGFESIEHALNWFKDDMLDYLIRGKWTWHTEAFDYRLSVYEVPQVFFGDHQAVAAVADLEPVEKISLVELKTMRYRYEGGNLNA